jgi:hypothetical protein
MKSVVIAKNPSRQSCRADSDRARTSRAIVKVNIHCTATQRNAAKCMSGKSQRWRRDGVELRIEGDCITHVIDEPSRTTNVPTRCVTPTIKVTEPLLNWARTRTEKNPYLYLLSQCTY